MRMTYTDILNDFLDKTGNTGQSSNTNLTNFFQRNLSARYQMAFSEINNRMTQRTWQGSTVVNQQFYHYPPGIVDLADATVQINGLNYPVITDDSLLQWDRINLVLIATTTVPQFVFPRRDDFGIWPIPQGVYTITITTQLRDRSLTTADYATGTVDCATNSQTVTGHGVTWTNAMIGRWFIMNDPTQQGQGWWYRIGSVNAGASTLTLDTAYDQTSVTGATYRIGESPELPEEVHVALADGVVADYYAGPRSDIGKATWFENKFWTGNGMEKEREDKGFVGGILGAKQRYSGRMDGAIVWQHGLPTSWTDRMWASGITP